jgi:hypothetical protein
MSVAELESCSRPRRWRNQARGCFPRFTGTAAAITEAHEKYSTKGNTMITGGSNYITINASMNSPAIGTFHLFPDKVAADLQSMFEHGQRKISLLCWYMPITWPVENHQWHHAIDSSGGVMSEQHQQNVISLINLITEIGFNQLHFRFSAQGDVAMADRWPEWNAAQFNENWNFVHSVRNLVDANKGGLKVVFDLAAEYARMELGTSPIMQLYCRRMWKLYTAAHGPDDSCAYTIIHGGTGLTKMLNVFKKVTPRLRNPGCYCIDSYGHEYSALTDAATVLTAANEIAKPVYIQETFYNDATSYADIKRAVAETHLNFQGIFQWPELRDHEHGDFPDVFCKRFDNYLVEV